MSGLTDPDAVSEASRRRLKRPMSGNTCAAASSNKRAKTRSSAVHQSQCPPALRRSARLSTRAEPCLPQAAQYPSSPPHTRRLESQAELSRPTNLCLEISQPITQPAADQGTLPSSPCASQGRRFESSARAASGQSIDLDNSGQERSSDDFIAHWTIHSTWPSQFFRRSDTMSLPLPKKRTTPSQKRTASSSQNDSANTPSDQRSRAEKSRPYLKASYEDDLAALNSFMDLPPVAIRKSSKDWCTKLLTTVQDTPQGTLLDDDIFLKSIQKLRNRNEARIVRDIALLVVPSAEQIALRFPKLKILVENVNEGWNQAVPICGPRPQPDFSVGFLSGAFTPQQREKLHMIAGLRDNLTTFFKATWKCYFPFLTSEVKSGAVGLDIADRQNAHSMTIAVRGVVELFRMVKREKQLNRKILSFSISHDDTTVRIHGHFPVIDGAKTSFYRHLIHRFDIVGRDGQERWTAYRFTRNVYDHWMPKHLKLLQSALDAIPEGINFDPSELSGSQFEQAGSEGLLAESSQDTETSDSSQEVDTGFEASQGSTAQTSVYPHPPAAKKQKR